MYKSQFRKIDPYDWFYGWRIIKQFLVSVTFYSMFSLLWKSMAAGNCLAPNILHIILCSTVITQSKHIDWWIVMRCIGDLMVKDVSLLGMMKLLINAAL